MTARARPVTERAKRERSGTRGLQSSATRPKPQTRARCREPRAATGNRSGARAAARGPQRGAGEMKRALHRGERARDLALRQSLQIPRSSLPGHRASDESRRAPTPNGVRCHRFPRCEMGACGTPRGRARHVVARRGYEIDVPASPYELREVAAMSVDARRAGRRGVLVHTHSRPGRPSRFRSISSAIGSASTRGRPGPATP